MLTLSDLMSNTDQQRQQKASGCSVVLVDTFHTIEDKPISEEFKSYFANKTTLMTYYITFKFEVTSAGSKTPHKVFIQLNPDFDLKYWEGNKCRIACDCEDFKYHSVYYIKQYDSLFETDRLKIIYAQSLTQPPKSTTSLLCKHGIAALNYLVNNYQNLMRNI